MDAAAQAEITITETMIEAGLDALIRYRGDGDVLTVTEIARAILRQLPGSTERQAKHEPSHPPLIKPRDVPFRRA